MKQRSNSKLVLLTAKLSAVFLMAAVLLLAGCAVEPAGPQAGEEFGVEECALGGHFFEVQRDLFHMFDLGGGDQRDQLAGFFLHGQVDFVH